MFENTLACQSNTTILTFYKINTKKFNKRDYFLFVPQATYTPRQPTVLKDPLDDFYNFTCRMWCGVLKAKNAKKPAFDR